MKTQKITCLLLIFTSVHARRRSERSEFGSSVEFGNSVEFSPTSPTSPPPPPPSATTASPGVVFPTKRVRTLYREQDRNIRTSSWSSWSQNPGRSTTVRRPSTGRSRSPVERIVVFPCQEAAMRCEYRPRDVDYPYRCKWTQLPQTPMEALTDEGKEKLFKGALSQ